MGAVCGEHNITNTMSLDIKDKIMRLFRLIDYNNSNTIEREEALRYWSNTFPKINSKQLFDDVDKNYDGKIQLSEWLEFWQFVLNSGYSEKEVGNELDQMISKQSWVKFDTKTKFRMGTNTSMEKIIKEGKL